MIQEKKLSEEELAEIQGGAIIITTGAIIGGALAIAGLGTGFYFGHK